MIGSSMAIGISAAVAANPCVVGAASVVLESFDKDRRIARASRNLRQGAEPVEDGMGILRIAQALA